MTKSIMLCGVGGQGTLLASRVLGRLFLGMGCDVKVSEVHGMSQRGGSVVTYVRYGECVASPTIESGGADVIVAFEALEALRWAPYLKTDGLLVMSTQQIMPMPVITGAAEYPQDIPQKLAGFAKRLVAFDALAPAVEAGSAKAVNIVLLGALSAGMDIPEEQWLAALRGTVPEKILAVNLAAFAAGRAEGLKSV